MMARSTTRSNQRPDTLMQDRHRQFDEIFLQRTAGPYIRVKMRNAHPSGCRPLRLVTRTLRSEVSTSHLFHQETSRGLGTACPALQVVSPAVIISNDRAKTFPVLTLKPHRLKLLDDAVVSRRGIHHR